MHATSCARNNNPSSIPQFDGAGDRRNDNGDDDDDERAEQATRGEDSPPVF